MKIIKTKYNYMSEENAIKVGLKRKKKARKRESFKKHFSEECSHREADSILKQRYVEQPNTYASD